MSVLDVLRERGFVAQVSDEPGLRAAFARGTVTAYCGYDATARSLHVGHLLQIMLLSHLQRAGHRPICVTGGGTTVIGDPTGRSTERPLLSLAEIEQNRAAIQAQLSRYLDFSPGKAIMVNNADWLMPLKYLEFLRDVGRHFTVNQLMQHETYWERFQNSSLSFIELNYALVQAYDFLHLYREYGCLLQVGGNDQWFNILSGVELIRRAADGPAYALTTPLITTASGQKMGKSQSGARWLDPALFSPYDFYQFWRNAEDADVGRWLKFFTFLPLDEIQRLESLQGVEINHAKDVLAFEVTRIAHGEEEAQKAQQTTRARFSGEGEDQGPALKVSGPTPLIDLLVQSGLTPSRSEAKRKLKEGGVRLDGRPEKDDRPVNVEELPGLLSLGKRKIRLEPTSH